MAQSTLANIFTGMTGGPEAIMANLKAMQADLGNGAAVTADTGWTESGLSYVNGFVRKAVNPIMYRTISIGKVSITFWTGFINTPTDMAAWTSQTVVKFPAATVYPNGFMPNNISQTSWNTNASGHEQINFFSDHLEIRAMNEVFRATNNGQNINQVVISA